MFDPSLKKLLNGAIVGVGGGRDDLTSKVKGEEPRGSLLSVLFTAVLTAQLPCNSKVSPFPVILTTELAKMADSHSN